MKKCIKCHKEDERVHPDGNIVQDDLTCYMAYGSTTADGDMRRFPSLSPGFHCYDCLDAEVRDGRSEFVRAYMFLSHLRDEQKPGEPESMRQAIRQAMEHYDQILKVIRSGDDIKRIKHFIESRLYGSIKFAEEALGEKYEPMFGEAEDDTPPRPWRGGSNQPKEGDQSGS